MSQAVDLPEKAWSALQQAAKASGLTPAGWIAGACPRPTMPKPPARRSKRKSRTTRSRQGTPPSLCNGWAPSKLCVSPAGRFRRCHTRSMIFPNDTVLDQCGRSDSGPG